METNKPVTNVGTIIDLMVDERKIIIATDAIKNYEQYPEILYQGTIERFHCLPDQLIEAYRELPVYQIDIVNDCFLIFMRDPATVSFQELFESFLDETDDYWGKTAEKAEKKEEEEYEEDEEKLRASNAYLDQVLGISEKDHSGNPEEEIENKEEPQAEEEEPKETEIAPQQEEKLSQIEILLRENPLISDGIPGFVIALRDGDIVIAESREVFHKIDTDPTDRRYIDGYIFDQGRSVAVKTSRFREYFRAKADRETVLKLLHDYGIVEMYRGNTSYVLQRYMKKKMYYFYKFDVEKLGFNIPVINMTTVLPDEHMKPERKLKKQEDQKVDSEKKERYVESEILVGFIKWVVESSMKSISTRDMAKHFHISKGDAKELLKRFTEYGIITKPLKETNGTRRIIKERCQSLYHNDIRDEVLGYLGKS